MASTIPKFKTKPSPARDQNMGRKQEANHTIVPLGTKYGIHNSKIQKQSPVPLGTKCG